MLRAGHHAARLAGAVAALFVSFSTVAAAGSSMPPGTREARERDADAGYSIGRLSLAHGGEGSSGFAGVEGWVGNTQFLGRLETFEGKVDALADQVVELSRALREVVDRGAQGQTDAEQLGGSEGLYISWARMCALSFLAGSVLVLGACLCVARPRCHRDAQNYDELSAGFQRLRQQHVWRKIGHAAGWCGPVPAEQVRSRVRSRVKISMKG
jgi:hypothetical protein